MLATQLRALDEVTALATEHSYVRQALAVVLRDSYLSPRYKENELRVSSLKAVISIKDNEVHEFWSYYRNLMRSVSMRRFKPNNPDVLRFERRLAAYLRYTAILQVFASSVNFTNSDPDVSFLVARHLREANDVFLQHRFERAWGSYFDAAIRNPHIIEWDTLNVFFSYRSWRTENLISTRAGQIMR